jgi:hypothetical protein
LSGIGEAGSTSAPSCTKLGLLEDLFDPIAIELPQRLAPGDGLHAAQEGSHDLYRPQTEFVART